MPALEARRRSSLSCAWLNVAVYAVAAAALLLTILAKTHGHFSYCLDDPYIHLALAERVRHGFYGLNAGEPSSPSSSIVWPLLLVPFAGTALMSWVPLVLNLLCGGATAWLLGRFVEIVFPAAADLVGMRGHWRSLLLGLLLVGGLNLLGLVFTGLEHPLELLLCVCGAFTALAAMRGERVPWWAVAAAALLPSVRYEGLLVTFAVALTLWGVRARGTAVALLGSSLVVPAAFSVFLQRLGLPLFPLSVLVKSSYKFADHSPLPMRVVHLVKSTLQQALFDRERLPQLLLLCGLVWLAWRFRRSRRVLFAVCGATCVAAVQLVLGPVGWFFRYEIYALAYTLLVLLAALALLPQNDVVRETAHPIRQPAAWVLLGVAAIAVIYVRVQTKVPRAAVGIYEQQYQLGRLTSQFYPGPVAVNDLGWVSFTRTPQQYVLDLYGLGSYEVFRTPLADRNAAWMSAIVHEHRIGLVAIYPEWFPNVPAEWTRVAKLCSAHLDTTLGPVSKRVMLYGTADADMPTLQDALRRFRAALDPGTTMQLMPEDSSASCRL